MSSFTLIIIIFVAVAVAGAGGISYDATITGYFGFVFGKTRPGKSRDYCEDIIWKSSFLKMFSVQTKTQRFHIPLV